MYGAVRVSIQFTTLQIAPLKINQNSARIMRTVTTKRTISKRFTVFLIFLYGVCWNMT